VKRPSATGRRTEQLLILVAVWSLLLLMLRENVLPAGNPVRAIAWTGLVMLSIRVLAKRFL
jgi:hypothetical protein